jgi:cephalosporin-C deacetylase
MKLRLMLCLAAIFATVANAGELNFTPLKASSIYTVGEQAGWTVVPAPGLSPNTTYSYVVRSDGATEIARGTFDFSHGSATISTTLDHPGMIYVTVDRVNAPPPGQPSPAEASQINASLKALVAEKNPDLKPILSKYPDLCLLSEPCAVPAPKPAIWLPPLQAHLAVLGAAVSPAKIKPSVPRPADFDTFWSAKLAEAAKVPAHPQFTQIPASVPGIKLYKVQLDSLNSHVQGYLALPNRKGRFPAMIVYQWAGVYALLPDNCANRAAEGWLCFNVSSHDMPLESSDGAPNNYPEVGNTSRETSYFLNMYLRDTRALDWVRTLKSWNRKTLVVTGTSMGGQQSLVTAGLNPGKITAVVVNVPAGADSNGALYGRMAAYPNWPVSDPRVAETARYFDTANFTPKITAPTIVALGFIDSVCPPASVFSAANQIPVPHEIIPMPESDHNNYTPDKEGAFLQRSEEVFAVLLHGGRFVPNQSVSKMP